MGFRSLLEIALFSCNSSGIEIACSNFCISSSLSSSVVVSAKLYYFIVLQLPFDVLLTSLVLIGPLSLKLLAILTLIYDFLRYKSRIFMILLLIDAYMDVYALCYFSFNLRNSSCSLASFSDWSFFGRSIMVCYK